MDVLLAADAASKAAPWWGAAVISGSLAIGGALLGGLATQVYHVWNSSRDNSVNRKRELETLSRQAVAGFLTVMNRALAEMVLEKKQPDDALLLMATSELQILASDSIIVAARCWRNVYLKVRKSFREAGKLNAEDTISYNRERAKFMEVVRAEYKLEPLSAVETSSSEEDVATPSAP
jgi:hypothetical protein